MKSIVDILNSMAQAPTDPSDLLKKGFTSKIQDPSNGESFEDVLSRLTVQSAALTGSGGVQNDATSSVNSNEVSSAVLSAQGVRQAENIPSVRVSTMDLRGLEQGVVAIKTALSQLVNLTSNVQNLPTEKAQNAIVSAAGGAITPAQALDLLTKIDATKDASSGKDPLDLTAEQQGALVVQFLQNAIQNQQVTLVQNGPESNVSNLSSEGRPSENLLAIQLDLSGRAGNNSAQGGQEILSLDMKALSIRTTTPTESKMNLPQAATERLTRLLQDLQVTPASKPVDIKVQTAVVASGYDPEMKDNFKNLVQVLTQAGAGQAILNTFLSREKNTSPSVGPMPTLNVPAEEGFRGMLPSVEIPPVTSARPNDQANPLSPESIQLSTRNIPEKTAVETPVLSGEERPTVSTFNQVTLKNTPEQSGLVALETTQIPVVNTPVNQVAVDHVSQVLQAPIVSIATVTNQANVQTPNTQAVLGQSDLVAINTSNKPSAQTQPVLMDGHLEAVNNIVARFNSGVVHGKVAASNTLRTVNPETVQQSVGPQSAHDVSNPTSSVVKVQSTPISTSLVQQEVAVNSADVQSQMNQSNSSATQQAHANLDPVLKNDVFQDASAKSNLAVSAQIGERPLTTLGQNNSSSEQGAAAIVTPVVIQQTVTPTGNPVQMSVPLTGTTQTVGVTLQASIVTSPVTLTQPTSTATNIPATAVVGEVVKIAVPPPSVENTNIAATTPQVVTSVSSVPAVQPVTAQAVTQVSTTLETSTGVRVSANLDKDTSSDVLNIQTAAGAASASIVGSQTGKSGDYEKVVAAAGSNASNMDATQVLGQISRQIAAQTAATRTVTQLNFQLFPESLGKVTVQVALVDQSISARIVVSNPEIREVLQHHMVDLKSALNQAGLQIDQLQVQVQGGGASLLAQYYQYQQEGGAYRPGADLSLEALETLENVENKGALAVPTGPVSLVNLLV